MREQQLFSKTRIPHSKHLNMCLFRFAAKGRVTNLQARGHRRHSGHEDTEHEDTEDTEDTGIASVMDLYNTVVDGLAGFLVVDLRSAEEYDEEHVWGAVLNILFFYFYFYFCCENANVGHAKMV